jgi:hypothetical protein
MIDGAREFLIAEQSGGVRVFFCVDAAANSAKIPKAPTAQ